MTEREYRFDVPEWLRQLLNLASETSTAMFDAEQVKKDPQMFEYTPEARQRFTFLLRRLYFWYEPKFGDTSKVSLPDDLKKQLEEPEDVYELNFSEARKLFRSIRNLMEEIGHTRFSSEKHTEEGHGMPNLRGE